MGYPGKHGKQGIIDDRFIMFEGSKVLIFPADLLLGDDDYIYEKYDSVLINYDLPFSEMVVPYLSDGRTLSTELNWMKYYDLRSSCYYFGNSHKREYQNNSCSLNIHTQKPDQLEESVYEGIFQVFNYYCDIFFKALKADEQCFVFNLILTGHEKNIMGGSGFSTAGYSFDPALLRNWELLSHRMFHAFFDKIISSKSMRIPPQLWLYEGLASYYESKSLEFLSNDIKEKIRYTRNEYFWRLALRYLYFRIKYSKKFALIPMEEKNYIKDKALIEFLHYTQAPLLVYIIEQLAGDERNNNIILKEIINIKKTKITGKSGIIFNSYTILLSAFETAGRKEEFADFLKKYVYGSKTYPVKLDFNDDPEAVVEELNYYNYVIGTWSTETLEKNISFADEETENIVRDISQTLYKILKADALSD